MARIGRLAHRKGEAIDEFGVPAFPQPLVGCLLLHLGGDFPAHIAEGGFGEFVSRPAVVARVGSGDRGAALLLMAHHLRDGRLTGRFLAVAQHLAEKRPTITAVE